MSSPEFKARKIATRKRRLAVREMVINGHANVSEIAARHGTSLMTASRDIKWVMRGMQREEEKLFQGDIQRRRPLRVRQLLIIYREAMFAFKRSQQNATRTSTTSKWITCPDCDGKGTKKNPDKNAKRKYKICQTCQGDGEFSSDVTTTESKGQAGDPAHLNAAIKALREINLLEGNYAPVQQKVTHDGRIDGVQVHITQQQQDEKLKHVPRDRLLEAMAMIDDLYEEAAQPLLSSNNVVEGTVVPETNKHANNNEKDANANGSRKRRKKE